MSDDTASRHEGGCLCGAVRYRVAAEPSWVAHCHCHSCRRATGAPVTTLASFPSRSFEIVSGAPADYASSPGVTRSFCARCGTPLTYRAPLWLDEVHVHISTLDRPERFAPTAQAYTDEAIPWLHVDEHLRRYAKTSREDSKQAKGRGREA